MEMLSKGARQVLDDLAHDFKIKGSLLIRVETKKITTDEFNELLLAGFISALPNGDGFQISDEGRKAFLKSTDELGDGVVRVYLNSSA